MKLNSQFNRVQKENKPQGLNLVALMDIFTVLVFFLIFNVHSEQVVANVHIQNLPISNVALDELYQREDVDVLEVVSANQLIFNGNSLKNSNNLKQYCVNSKSKCNILALLAPENINYAIIDRFVALGRKVGFRDIYLVVKTPT